MKKHIFFIFILLSLTFIIVSCKDQQKPLPPPTETPVKTKNPDNKDNIEKTKDEELTPEEEELLKKGKMFLDLLTKEEFSEGIENFNNNMKERFPEETLSKNWQAVLRDYGAFKKNRGYKIKKIDNQKAVILLCEFEKMNLNITIVFDKDKKISRLHFVPQIE